MHNKGVSYFEECLKFGDMLLQDERRALYKYLLETNRDLYTFQANELLDVGKVSRIIADGESSYFVSNNYVSYSARQLHSDEISTDIRTIRLTKLRIFNLNRLRKFFAQADVDVIRNFPLRDNNLQKEGGYGINVNPYYSLAYYVNGKNYLVGLIKKIRTNDKELLTKLRTL